MSTGTTDDFLPMLKEARSRRIFSIRQRAILVGIVEADQDIQVPDGRCAAIAIARDKNKDIYFFLFPKNFI